MFPFDEDQLYLGQIAGHWVAELDTTHDSRFALNRLWRDYWQGALAAAEDEDRPIRRQKFLKVIFKHGEDIPIVFVDDPAETKSEIDYDSLKPDKDGLYDIDTRLRIYLPADTASWSNEILEAAYEVLAKTEVTQFDVGLCAGFAAQSISRQSLEECCRQKDYALPRFWFRGAGSRTRTKFTVKAEAECRRWFRDLIKSSKPRRSKSELLEEAQGLFPGLSERAFNRIWSQLAPPDWKARGRPKNPAPRTVS